MADKIDKISINNLLRELIDSGDCKIYSWEQLVIFPVANQSQVLIRGINNAITSQNYICAVSLLRSLMESAMVLVYDTSIKKDNEDEYYKQLIDNGRLRRWSNRKRKWENTRDDHLIKQFKIATKLDIEDIYHSSCDILHFSTKHSELIFARSSTESNIITVEIGESGPKMPKIEYDKIKKIVDDLIFIIKTQIAAAIHQKRITNKEKPSKGAEVILSGRNIQIVK